MIKEIEVYPICALLDNYIWVIKPKGSNKIIVVDPGEYDPVINFLTDNKLELAGIFLTHHHPDHTDGVAPLTEKTNIPIWSKHTIKNNEVNLHDLELSFKVINTPGHTLDHIAFYGHGALFCGDTLFAAGMGKIFEGNPQQMFSSIKKLSSLPRSTKMYCAHEYTLDNIKFARHVDPNNQQLKARELASKCLRAQNKPTIPSTIADELDTNPFLRSDIKAIEESVSKHLNKNITEPLEVFTQLRAWKDNF